MPFSRSIDGNLSQEGHLTGLEGISVERTIELIPSLTVSQNSRFVPALPATQRAIDAGRIVNEPVGLDLGLTARFIPSSAVTVDLALNADFAQVEADQLVVTAFYADYDDDLNHDSRHPFTNQVVPGFRRNSARSSSRCHTSFAEASDGALFSWPASMLNSTGCPPA